MPLLDYINQHYSGNQAAFARSLKTTNGTKVQPAQITQWIKKDAKVIDHTLYLPVRKLK